MGKPYSGPVVGQPESWRHGDPGWDCSSFVSGVFAHFGVSLVAFTDSMYDQLVPDPDPTIGRTVVFFVYNDDDQPGVFSPHVGLYVNNAITLDCRYPEGVGYHAMLNTRRDYRKPKGW